MVDKDRWQQFFEQAQEEFGLSEPRHNELELWFDALAERADELYTDYEADLVDAAYEQLRDG